MGLRGQGEAFGERILLQVEDGDLSCGFLGYEQ
jgi:hypothetical protein